MSASRSSDRAIATPLAQVLAIYPPRGGVRRELEATPAMRPSPVTLLEGSLAFDRSGQTLIAAAREAILIIELDAGGRTTRLPIRDARAVAAFPDQLWIATHDDQLVRVDRAGRLLGAPRALPFAARAVLEPAPCGPPAAIWPSTPAVALIADSGRLAAAELADVDLALPLTGRRFVTARGATLGLPSGLVTTLAPGTCVLGGAVMSDGRSVTLLVAHRGGRQLIVVALGTGQITRRFATPSSTLRLATRRGLAVVLVEPRLIRILDLHTGRELGTAGFDDDVDDFAIDRDGQTLAVCRGNGSIELHPLADLLPGSPEARTVAPPSGPLDTSSPSPADTVPDMRANLFDLSNTDDEPTLNIRRSATRPDPGPGKLAPDPQDGDDLDVITSAPRIGKLAP